MVLPSKSLHTQDLSQLGMCQGRCSEVLDLNANNKVKAFQGNFKDCPDADAVSGC